jgi:hypothetical protein
MSGVEPLALADVPAVLCAVLSHAGQPKAVAEAVEVVERLEFSRSWAPRHLWREYDLALRRALETLRVVREHAPWSAPPPPLPSPVPRRCEARWRMKDRAR